MRSLFSLFLFSLLFVACGNEQAQSHPDADLNDEAAIADDFIGPVGDDEEEKDESDLSDTSDEIADELLVDDQTDPSDQTDQSDQADDVLPDIDMAPADCQINTDCPFGSRCDTTTSPHECFPMSTCKSDTDCATYEKCAIVDNWKQCQMNLASKECDSEGNCGFGEICETIYGLYDICRSMNECATNDECLEGELCESNGQYLECVTVCQIDTDCPFGYRCSPASPHNLCLYANECVRDSDCESFNTCEAFGNWMQCTVNATGKFCSDDNGCDPSEYCDLLIGPVGGCKSRDQCHVDADCDDINLVCASNGVYYECVTDEPKDCFVDQQCPNGWACSPDNVCVPPYAGVCPEVEGVWAALVSENLLIPQGTIYEFVPENGCAGKILPQDQQIEAGSFSQTAPGQYDLTMALFLQCTGQLTMATIMELTCPNGNATLVKTN